MAAQLARIEQLPAGPAPSRRKVERQAANTRVRLRSTHGDRANGHLIDLSLHGCSVRLDTGSLRCGAFISIAIGNHPALQAIIRWVQGETAGMEFLATIPAERSEWHGLLRGSFGS